MDQRFPLHVSMSSHQHTDGIADTNITPIDSRSASPISDTENPSQTSTSRSPGTPSQIASAPSQIASAPLSGRYSPQFGSAFSPPDLYQSINLLPQTIPTLDQPTPLTNPLPFQHEHRNQVPIDIEYPTAMSVQDAILPAPPPYTRYAGEAPPKSDAERRGPQLEMIDVTAAVRGLPTVHIAVGANGNVTSTNASSPSSDPDNAGAFVLQNSDSEVSMQSAQGRTFSINSNRLLFRGGISEEERKEKVQDDKRLCGVRLWWILLAIAFVSILLSIVLGVTLGLVSKLKKNSESPPPDRSGNPDDQQNPIFPQGTVLVPLMLVKQSRDCLANNSTLPGLTGQVDKVLWACDLPGHQLHFEITENDHSGNSYPQTTLPPKIGVADKADLAITSPDGDPKAPGFVLYEGVQPPSFSHQPLHRVDKSESTGRSAEYEFRVLYLKGIVLRVSTIEKLLVNDAYLTGHAWDMGIGSTGIGKEETIWSCEWDKTYLEGKIWMDMNRTSSKGSTGSVDPAFHMTLQESRLSHQELQQLFPGNNTSDANKGVITCKKGKSDGKGGVVDIPARKAVDTSNEISKAQSTVEEQDAVERVVRKWFRRNSILRRDSSQLAQSQPTERTDGKGQCLCAWERDPKL